MKKLSISQIFLFINLFFVALLFFMGFLAVRFFVAHNNLNEAHKQHKQALSVVETMGKNMVALSQNALLFAETGNLKHREAYFEKLAQRNGKSPRSDGSFAPLSDYFSRLKPGADERDLFLQFSELSEKQISEQKSVFQGFRPTGETENPLLSESYQNRKDSLQSVLGDLHKLCVQTRLYEVEKRNKKMLSLSVALLGSVFLSLLLMLLIGKLGGQLLRQPLEKIYAFSLRMAEGDLSQRLDFDRDDELGEIGKAQNRFFDELKAKAGFISELSDGKLDSQYNPASGKDQIGKALLGLRQSLVSAKQEQARREKEDEIRNWTTHGIALFGDVIRKNSGDLNQQADSIIQNLVHYLKINQGGLFILNDQDKENPRLELLAAYAYDRKKFHSKEIEPGEGLVGTCAIEKQTIYLTEIPEDYIEITSGLGKAVPTSLLIVPLQIESKVLGVVELAAFEEFKKHEIEFVEKIGENIASALMAAQMSRRSEQLLEESQRKARQMEEQEEEMRQNMEELRSTQDELAKKDLQKEMEIEVLNTVNDERMEQLQDKERQMQGILNALNNSTLMLEYNLDGKIQEANQPFLNLLGIEKQELEGKTDLDFIADAAQRKAIENQIWNQIKAGKIAQSQNKYLINKQEIWLSETYTPVFDKDGKIQKVLKISADITNEKQRELQLEEIAQQQSKIKESQKRTIDKIIKRSDRLENKLRRRLEEKEQEVEQLKKQLGK